MAQIRSGFMTHPREYLPVLDHVEAALEAACAALLTLQSMDVLASNGETDGEREHVADAVLSLRHAINELREAETRGQSGLALGFVLAGGRRKSSGGGPDQSRPRRTA